MEENQHSQANDPEFWFFIIDLYNDHGLWVFFLLFVCYLFWRLIWKVWSVAMKSKDDEIDRLVKERDKYQNLVFDRLISSETTEEMVKKVRSAVNNSDNEPDSK